MKPWKKSQGLVFELSDSDVEREIKKYMEAHKSDIETKRYSIVPSLLGDVKKVPELKWAKPNLFKPIIDSLVLEMIGPKDERDVVKKEKKKLTKKQVETKKEAQIERSMFSEGFLGDLHKPGENRTKIS